MHTIFTIFIMFGTMALSWAQQVPTDSSRKIYITLKGYKLTYKTPLTKQDSLSFKFRENDTLVAIKPNMMRNGKSVPYEYQDETFLTYYKKAAFRSSGVDSTDQNQVMRYWKTPLKIYFSKSIPRSAKKEFMSLAKSISKQVDSLQIYEVKKVDASNYVVYSFGDYEYDTLMKNYTYTDYYLHWNNRNQIYRSGLKIDQNVFFTDALVSSKLRELFIGTLGHFKFLDDFSCESYFSDCYSKNKQLTNLDLQLLQYHYSYGICKGTNLSDFEEQHSKAKTALEKHNVLLDFFHLD